MKTNPSIDNVSAYHFSGNEPNEYYASICQTLIQQGKETAPRGLKTKELHPTTAHLYKPRNRVTTTHGRVLNMPFALAEVIQILTGQNDAQALRFYNSQIIDIQGDPRLADYTSLDIDASSRGVHERRGELLPGWRDHVERFNAFYGERLREYRVTLSTTGRVDQLEHVIRTLQLDPDSRQASIVLSHPYYDNYTRQTKDRACNVYCHAMIRDRKLDWMQIIRSNDAVWGIPYNLMQFSHLMEWVSVALGIQMGNMFIVQDSFHVYEPKYAECEAVQPFNLYDYFDWAPLQMLAGDSVAQVLQNTEYNIRVGMVFKRHDWVAVMGNLGVYWTAVMEALYSFAQFKLHCDEKAYDELPDYSEIQLPMLRMYCHYRWNKQPVKYNDLIMKALSDVIAIGVPHREAEKWLGIV